MKSNSTRSMTDHCSEPSQTNRPKKWFSDIRFILLLISMPLLISVCNPAADSGDQKWVLIWEDHFEGNTLDSTKWTLISTSPERWERASDWNRHMIADERVYKVENGHLYLTGINNPGIPDDPRPFLTGGVDSKGKFHFLYGKAEIRAKKECAQGAWPALWMMPEESVYGGWPHSGEIDIMEHLNFDSVIHHTVHTRYTNVLKNTREPRRGIGNIVADVTEWNIYGLEWYPDTLIWTLNGEETFRYPRVEGLDPEMIQWPYDQSFYFIMSHQLGGSWVGKINPDHLPTNMIIDYVKVYQLKE